MKTPKPIRATVKLDLSEWELGGWPDELSEILTVEKDAIGGGVAISFGFEDGMFEALARKIATEAIEAFFADNCLLLWAEVDGIHLKDHEEKTLLVNSWDSVFVGAGRETIAAIRAALEDQEQELDVEERMEADGQSKTAG